MMTLAGGACLMLGTFWSCRIRLSEQSRCMEMLHALILALRRAGDSVRVTRTPMMNLLDQLGTCEQPDAAQFFQAVAAYLREEHPLSKAWQEAVPILALSQRSAEILMEAGCRLNGDDTAVLEVLTFTAEQLQKELDELEHLRAQEAKRLIALHLSAAALAIILLT